MKTCVNCGFESGNKHCPECGQKLEIPRITLKGTILEFFARWIGFDNQFGRTVKHMFAKPGEVIKTYLNGNRVKYLGPLGYLIVMTALLLLSFDIFGVRLEDYMSIQSSEITRKFANEDPEVSSRQLELQSRLMPILVKNFRLMTVSFIPFLALSFGWFYKKEKLNYMERFMIFSFISGNALWLNIIGVATFALTGKGIATQMHLISLLYTIYAIQNSYPKRPIHLGIGRILLTILVGYIVWFFAYFIVLSPVIFSILKSISES